MEAIVLIFFLIIGGAITSLVLGVLGYFEARNTSRRLDGMNQRLSTYREEIQKLNERIKKSEAGKESELLHPPKAATATPAQATTSTPPAPTPVPKERKEPPPIVSPSSPVPLAQAPTKVHQSLVTETACHEVKHAPTPPAVPNASTSTATPNPAPAPAPESSFPWRALLAQVHLLPPDGKSSEANLAAWWTTRIGIILAVISAVFFAVHVSQGIPAWLKFAELLGASVLVTGLGQWLSKRPRVDLGNTNIDTIKYGQVIFGGGLALIFLSAFAAYAFEPVKVIHSPVLATLLQFVTAAGIMLTAWFRQRPLIASMSTLLGFIACWFGQSQGVDWFVLGAMALLAISGCGLFITRGWSGPAWISLAGTFGTFITLVTLVWSETNIPIMFHVILVLIIYWGTFLATDLFAEVRKQWQALPASYRKIFISANSTLTVGCGYLYFSYFHQPDIHLFYLGAGLTALAAAYLCYFPRGSDYGFHNYFLKASSLIAIGLVYYLDGPAEWISLSIQAAAMLWAAKNSHSVWLEGFFHTAIGIVWLMFLNDTLKIEGYPGGWSAPAAWSIVFISILTTLLSLQAKLFSGRPAPWKEARRTLNAALGIALGITALIHCSKMYAEGAPLLYYACGLAVALTVIGTSARHWIGVLSGAFLFLVAQVMYFGHSSEITTSSTHLYLFIMFAGLSVGAYFTLKQLSHRSILPDKTNFRSWLTLACSIFVVAPAFRALYSGGGMLDTTGFTLAPYVSFIGILLLATWRLYQVRDDAEHLEYHISARLVSLIFGILLCISGFHLFHETGEILIWCVSAAVLGACAFILRNKLMLYAGIPSLLSAFVYYCSGSFSETIGTQNVYPLIVGVVLITLFLSTLGIAIRFKDTALAFPLDAIGWCSILIAYQVTLFRNLSLEWASIWVLISFIAIYFLRIARRFPALADTQWILPVGMCTTWLYYFVDKEFQPQIADSGLYVGLSVLGLIILCLPHMGFFQLRAKLDASLIGLIQTTLWAVTLMVFTYAIPFSDWMRLITLMVALLITAGINPFIKNVWLYVWQWILACGISHHVLEMHHEAGIHSTVSLFLTGGMACLCIVLAGIIATPQKIFTPARNNSLHYWVSAILAMGLYLIYTCRESFELSQWTTVLWGLGAITIFVTGFLFHCRPYRMVGLAGLALCIPRVFIFDIVEAFHRIIAFGVLAVVLLSIGFIYSKYKDRIDL